MSAPHGEELACRLAAANEAFQRGDAHACVMQAEALHSHAVQHGHWAVAADAALLLSRAHFNYFEISGVMRWVDATLAAGQAGGLKYPQARAQTIAASVHAMNDARWPCSAWNAPPPWPMAVSRPSSAAPCSWVPGVLLRAGHAQAGHGRLW
jgi:hypothetical protein